MYIAFYIALTQVLCMGLKKFKHHDSPVFIDLYDLTRATTWRDLNDYYTAVEKQWHICFNCGFPTLGTGIHLEYTGSIGSMHPGVIPSEYLLSRLIVIDVSSLVKINPELVLTLDVALQWLALKYDPREPTVLLFKFGWEESPKNFKRRSCVCKIPGLSYELAEWISTNMSHVVGIATDTPTLESEETREMSSRTVSNLFGKNGIYMIENVNLRRKIPERGCLALVMPLKLLTESYVPARFLAFCPSSITDRQVVIGLMSVKKPPETKHSRIYDVNLDEILN